MVIRTDVGWTVGSFATGFVPRPEPTLEEEVQRNGAWPVFCNRVERASRLKRSGMQKEALQLEQDAERVLVLQ